MPRTSKKAQKPGVQRLSDDGLIRLADVLMLIPVSESAWWRGVAEARYPRPLRLGPRTVAWRTRDILSLIESFAQTTRAE